ncbi:MAG: type IV secretory system conjugative DNA transfer family protein [Rickettsiales bacterium]
MLDIRNNKTFIAIANKLILIILLGTAILVCFIISSFLFVYLTKDISRDYNKLLITIKKQEFLLVFKNLYLIFYKWSLWLYNNFNKFNFYEFNYIKLKITVSLFAPISILIIACAISFRKIIKYKFVKEKEFQYGNAHWATQEEIAAAKLREKEGLLLGKDENGYFVAGGYEHALLFAPTGSGKGVGFVIPNCLFWKDSMFVHDIKLENYELTSGWRLQQGQKIFVWEPSNPDGITHCYNPMDWISKKPGQMVDDVQKIANLIITEKDFWNNEARSLFLGVVLYLIADDTKVKTFGQVVRTLKSDDVILDLAAGLDEYGEKMHPAGYMNLAAFLQKPDKERGSVLSTLNSGLELWANPLIDAATATSDFNIMNFKKERTTVYVGLTPDNTTRLQKLMQVFYQQAVDFLCRKMPDLKEEPYGVLFLMDEFPTLGKMEQFKTGIAFFRGYRVKLFLIVQDTQQLKAIYEEAGMNSFLSNSMYRITFAANNYETATLISNLCGTKTVEQESYGVAKLFKPDSGSKNVSYGQRALLLPQEVIMLPRDEQIILIESKPPIKSKKIIYFQDPDFKVKLLPKTEVPQQKETFVKKIL